MSVPVTLRGPQMSVVNMCFPNKEINGNYAKIRQDLNVDRWWIECFAEKNITGQLCMEGGVRIE